MLKRCGLLFALFVFLLTVYGCETVKGTFQGAVGGAASGAKSDWAAAKKADDWMRKNLW